MEKRPHKVLEDEALSDWERAMLFQNVQRTRLSNERNFLNWVRASLAFMTLGFVMHRFELFVRDTGAEAPGQASNLFLWLPLVFLFLGGALVALGTWEFFRVRKEINEGRWIGIPVIRDLLIITTLISLLVVLIIFVATNI